MNTAILLQRIMAAPASVRFLIAFAAASLAATAALAFTAPAAGDLGFDIYDLVVNQGVEGPLGLMAGVVALAFGAFQAISGRVITGVMAIIAGGVLISAEGIVTSLGFVV